MRYIKKLDRYISENGLQNDITLRSIRTRRVDNKYVIGINWPTDLHRDLFKYLMGRHNPEEAKEIYLDIVENW